MSGADRAHDRLEDDVQRLGLDRAAQVRLEVEAGEHVALHPHVEDGVARLALRLGAVHRDIGVVDQLERIDVRPSERDADRTGDVELAPDDLQRIGQRAQHTLGDDRGLARVRDVLEQHGELVAADPRDRVAGPQRGVQAQRDRLQQLVAGLMAERVVDDLEMVEVDEQHRSAGIGPATTRASQRLLQPVEEEGAVRQACQRIVQGIVVKPRDRAAVIGRVAHGTLQRAGVEPRLGKVIDRAVRARRAQLVGAARVAEHDHLHARVLLEQLVQRGAGGK